MKPELVKCPFADEEQSTLSGRSNVPDADRMASHVVTYSTCPTQTPCNRDPMMLLHFASRRWRGLPGELSYVLLLSTVMAISIVSSGVAVSQTVVLADQSEPTAEQPKREEPTVLRPASTVPDADVESPSRHAIVVVGLPGDDEHRQKFQQMAGVWRKWLVEVAGVQELDVMLLSSNGDGGASPATADSISARVAELAEQLQPHDSLWVFFLGHGSQDDRHGWFHIAGPDLNAVQWAEVFAPLEVNEQLFWFTQSASSSFLKPFARPGRVIITATADGEVNETRLPQTLTDIMRVQLEKDNAEPTSMPSTVLGLFREAALRVDRSFGDQQLVPTEHAQLDDNGDGIGTEVGDITFPTDVSTDTAEPVVDGAIANRIQITLPTTTETKSQP